MKKKLLSLLLSAACVFAFAACSSTNNNGSNTNTPTDKQDSKGGKTVEINVSAAASLKDALEKINENYKQATGTTVVLNLGGSGALSKQIKEGAPTDLFISASNKAMNELVENGTPLSAELLRKIYRELLVLYFGNKMHFESNSDMEGLRIPHFYSAFYVYKYATGISASLALARRVTEGGKTEREDYFNFLKSGGSRYPIESLRMAGVDMESPAPVQAALDEFARMVGELETLLGR